VNGTTRREEIEQQHAQMKARILGRLRNLPLSHAFSERAPSLPPPLPFFASLLRPLPQRCMQVDLALMGSADMAREHAHRARGEGADRRRRAEARNR
jgi:hypothetical protein